MKLQFEIYKINGQQVPKQYGEVRLLTKHTNVLTIHGQQLQSVSKTLNPHYYPIISLTSSPALNTNTTSTIDIILAFSRIEREPYLWLVGRHRL